MQINKQLIWVGVISFAAVQIGRTPLPCIYEANINFISEFRFLILELLV